MKFAYLAVLLLLLPCVSAATIQGVVYDLDLTPANAVVTISTQPQQRMVAVNGEYTFSVPPGTYTLNATYEEGLDMLSAVEPITIVEDGMYTLDLILFPEFDDVPQLEGIGLEEEEEVPLAEIGRYFYSGELFCCWLRGGHFTVSFSDPP